VSSFVCLLIVSVQVTVALDPVNDKRARAYTLGRTPVDEWSSRGRVLYLTTHNTQKRQIFMPSAGFEPAIPASDRPQNRALDGVATGIGVCDSIRCK